MKVHLYRYPGYTGRLAPLDVLVDGIRAGSLRGDESVSLTIPEQGGVIQVSMQGYQSSPCFTVPPGSEGMRLECGNPLWVLFDFLSLSLLPALKDSVFFLREAGTSTKGINVDA